MGTSPQTCAWLTQDRGNTKQDTPVAKLSGISTYEETAFEEASHVLLPFRHKLKRLYSTKNALGFRPNQNPCFYGRNLDFPLLSLFTSVFFQKKTYFLGVRGWITEIAGKLFHL